MYSSWRIILFLSTIVITSTSDEISGPLPIIGGACKVNSPDIPIGGKQTQFYLKCELNQQAQDGSGIWVVRSGASSTDQNYPSSAQTGSTYVESPNICVEDKNSKENEPCSVSETCLQSNENDPSTYLQCDLSSRRWMKKSCIGGSLFKFNLQNCEVQQSSQPAFMIRSSIQHNPAVQQFNPASQGNAVCTYTQCSQSNHCPQGICNNGYCCNPATSSNVGSSGALGSISSLSGSNIVLASPPCPGCAQYQQPIQSLQQYQQPMQATVQQYQQPIQATVQQYQQPMQPTVQQYKQYQPMQPLANPPSAYYQQGAQCASGCPRGYSGCCGTQQPSCCMRQMCPGGVPSTGRSCFGSCPFGEICLGGICCPQINAYCPGGATSYGPCTNGICQSGYQCNLQTGMCCPKPQLQYVCPGGGFPIGQCIGGHCPNGFDCVTGNVCCPKLPKLPSNPFICPDGTQAVGGCLNGFCGGGYKCVDGLCCNSTTAGAPKCLDGSPSAGACFFGRCGPGYTCTTGNLCCPSTATNSPVSFTCTDPNLSIGPCTNNQCSDNGFKCDATINACCPIADPIGPCIADNCPDDYTCFGIGIDKNCYPTCNNAGAPVGPAIAGKCAQGYTLIFGECCPSKLRSSFAYSSYGSPAYNMPSVTKPCPDNTPAISGCIGGLCGLGYECYNDICCAANHNPYSSRISSVVRPVGASCDHPQQCVGFSEGLSTCDMGYCRCLPMAYTQGIACVRRKALNFKLRDESLTEDKNEKHASEKMKRKLR